MSENNNNCPNLEQFQNFYLMGIKGVAMTSLAQILLDLGKNVSGCDVPDEFVTAKLLNRLNLQLDAGFVHDLPAEIDCVIYTAAHGGKQNPLIQQAISKNIPIVSQAEALACFFNQKKGAAVCGVGGKSTVSAMLTWILEKNNLQPSFSVGVGEILGLERTGTWRDESEIFVAEADEYAINPGELTTEDLKFIPRFSFLQPWLTVCTNLEYDHPDVYTDISHTRAVFSQFFLQIKQGGRLIINQDNQNLVELVEQLKDDLTTKQIEIKSFGEGQGDYKLLKYRVENQINIAEIELDGQPMQLKLKLPGKFNLLNALAACAAAGELGVPLEQALSALAEFRGTQRRFEFKGEKNGVLYYDDYAHHPNEVRQTIRALKEWHPNRRQVIAFQPHTYSRTKDLLTEFAGAMSQAQELLLLDIFPSARENYDPTISSDILMEQIKQINPQIKVSNVKTVSSLVDFCEHQLSEGDVLLTMGAGDVYEVHEMVGSDIITT